jgi:hypothetical protein
MARAFDGADVPTTKAAVERAVGRDPEDLALAGELHAQRIYFMAGLDTWKTYGRGALPRSWRRHAPLAGVKQDRTGTQHGQGGAENSADFGL